MKRIKRTALTFLQRGLHPSGIAAAISCGVVLGVFPIYGPVSLLCLATAWLLRLNLPVTFAAYYSMTFIKPVLIIPFLRLGEFLFRAEQMPLSLVELTRRFADDALGTLTEFGWSFLHATVGWMVMTPLLLAILYPIALLFVRRWNVPARPHVITAGIVCLMLVQTATTAGAEPAAHPSDVLFSDTVAVHDASLQLRGEGVLRFKRVFKIYDAALYLGADDAKRLEVVYRVKTKASRFADAGDKVLKRNYSTEELAQVQERLDRINSWYPDPKKGDRCAITYLPDRGTELTFNGKSLGIIEGKDFADIYFSIWLGDDPACPHLRKDLLNKESKS